MKTPMEVAEECVRTLADGSKDARAGLFLGPPSPAGAAVDLHNTTLLTGVNGAAMVRTVIADIIDYDRRERLAEMAALAVLLADRHSHADSCKLHNNEPCTCNLRVFAARGNGAGK